MSDAEDLKKLSFLGYVETPEQANKIFNAASRKPGYGFVVKYRGKTLEDGKLWSDWVKIGDFEASYEIYEIMDPITGFLRRHRKSNGLKRKMIQHSAENSHLILVNYYDDSTFNDPISMVLHTENTAKLVPLELIGDRSLSELRKFLFPEPKTTSLPAKTLSKITNLLKPSGHTKEDSLPTSSSSTQTLISSDDKRRERLMVIEILSTESRLVLSVAKDNALQTAIETIPISKTPQKSTICYHAPVSSIKHDKPHSGTTVFVNGDKIVARGTTPIHNAVPRVVKEILVDDSQRSGEKSRKSHKTQQIELYAATCEAKIRVHGAVQYGDFLLADEQHESCVALPESQLTTQRWQRVVAISMQADLMPRERLIDALIFYPDQHLLRRDDEAFAKVLACVNGTTPVLHANLQQLQDASKRPDVWSTQIPSYAVNVCEYAPDHRELLHQDVDDTGKEMPRLLGMDADDDTVKEDAMRHDAHPPSGRRASRRWSRKRWWMIAGALLLALLATAGTLLGLYFGGVLTHHSATAPPTNGTSPVQEPQSDDTVEMPCKQSKNRVLDVCGFPESNGGGFPWKCSSPGNLVVQDGSISNRVWALSGHPSNQNGSTNTGHSSSIVPPASPSHPTTRVSNPAVPTSAVPSYIAQPSAAPVQPAPPTAVQPVPSMVPPVTVPAMPVVPPVVSVPPVPSSVPQQPPAVVYPPGVVPGAADASVMGVSANQARPQDIHMGKKHGKRAVQVHVPNDVTYCDYTIDELKPGTTYYFSAMVKNSVANAGASIALYYGHGESLCNVAVSSTDSTQFNYVETSCTIPSGATGALTLSLQVPNGNVSGTAGESFFDQLWFADTSMP